ncbi:MAG: DUF72 domain-containing protein [Planctomycetota bacterium]
MSKKRQESPSGRGRLIFGTSSWSEKSWVGSFYPKGSKAGEYLTLYAEQFSTVEADVTYYRVPDPKLVEGWKRKTPDGFLLSAKFPRSIVHAGDGPRPDAKKVLNPEYCAGDLERFLESMSLLGEKCGPLVLQFPYFNRTAFTAPEPFFDLLADFLAGLPKGMRYAVEVRNKTWIKPELLDMLREHEVALVLVDLLYMPHPADLQKELDLLTTDFTYCRLIGDRKAVDKLTKSFDKVVLDQGARLDRWAELLEKYLARIPQVFAYANNHYAGHGPASIRELAEKMGIDAAGEAGGAD